MLICTEANTRTDIYANIRPLNHTFLSLSLTNQQNIHRSVEIELVAADALGGRAFIYIEENPGAPSGSQMTPSEKIVYSGQQFLGDAYRRTFVFTPTVAQVVARACKCLNAESVRV